MAFGTIGFTIGSGANMAMDTIGGTSYQRVKLVNASEDSESAIGVPGSPLAVSAGGATGEKHSGSLAGTALTGSFQTLLNPGEPIHLLWVQNFTNGDVVVSLDGGVTEDFTLAPGKERLFSFVENGIEMTVNIEVKNGSKVASGGTVSALAFSD